MKPQIKDTHMYFPVKVLADIKKIATKNRRTTTAEIIIAIERHIEHQKAQAEKVESANVQE